MPVRSERHRFLKSWRRFIEQHAYMRHIPELLDCYQFVCNMVDVVHHRRYLERSFSAPVKYASPSDTRILEIIQPMKEPEFRFHFRVNKIELRRLYLMVGDHPVFHNSTGRPQRHPIVQLSVFLALLGSGDRLGTIQRLFGGLPRGSVTLYTRRALVAVLSLFDRVVRWPDSAERREISTYLNHKHQLPDCIGFIDGSHVILARSPAFRSIEKNATFWSRKKRYGLLILAVCDHMKRFIYLQTGHFASATDFRAQASSGLTQRPEGLFDTEQFVLGDSGFFCTDHVVPMYRRQANKKLSAEQTMFNEHVAKVRVKIEHAFGVLKQRWTMLSNMRLSLRDQSDLEYAYGLIQAAVILHNLFIDTSNYYWDKEEFEEAQKEARALQAELEDAEIVPEPTPSDARQARRERLLKTIHWILG